MYPSKIIIINLWETTTQLEKNKNERTRKHLEDME